MKLSDEQKLKVEEHLEKSGVSFECPMCGNDTLAILDSLYEIKQYSKSNGMPSSKHVLINLLCSHCKFVAPFSAIEMGIAGTINEEKDS